MAMRTGGHIIVTGGAGFIGSALAHELAARGYSVSIVEVPGSDDRYRNLGGLALANYWHRDEFRAALRVGRLYPRPHAIFHLGACSSTLERDTSYLLCNNFAYTRTLAEWCLNHGVRFIYASSAATYGGGEFGYTDEHDLLPRLRPASPYAFSKHAFDLWALRHGAFSGKSAVTGLKYFNIYGPNEYHKGEMRSMVLKAYEQIQEKGTVRLFRSYRPDFANGDQRRDFLYVGDAVAITIWFLDHPEATGIYNVGSGVGRTWNELATAVFTALGREVKIQYADMPAQLRSGYQYDTCASLGRLRAAGCAQIPRSLEAGVNAYVGLLLSGHQHRPSLRPRVQPRGSARG